MKILFITHNGHPYGANKSLLMTMNALTEDHTVLLITPFRNAFLNTNDTINNLNIPFFPSIFFVKYKLKYCIYPFLILLDIIMFPFLLYQTMRFSPDLIYSNTSVENTGLLLAKITRKKHITHVREFGDLDYGLKCIFGKKFKSTYLNKSNGLIFNSKVVQDTVLTGAYKKTICAVIYNGICDSKNPYEYRKLDEKQINIGFIGFIQPQKGQLEAIRYLKNLLKTSEKCRLLIYGTGEKSYIRKITDYLVTNKLDKKVLIKGFEADIKNIYDSLDILFVFSKNEAFGRVTIEAMQKGIPVVAYRGGGTLELIDDKKDGLLFSNKEEFQLIINDLIANKQLYKTISSNAIKKIKSHFSEERYINEIKKFINKVFTSKN